VLYLLFYVTPYHTAGVVGGADVDVSSHSASKREERERMIAELEHPAPPPLEQVRRVDDASADHGSSFPVGYIRKPRIRLSPPTNPRLKGDDGKLHIIFSSGCNYFQHWQAEQVLATAFKVGQRGRITRIVSGCHDVSAESVAHSHQTFPSGRNDLLVPLETLNRSTNPYFGLYITPSFDGAKDFPWINKPSGIHHFVEHAMPELKRLGETVIAILDPDFIFLKPLTQTGELLEDIIYTGKTSIHGRTYPHLGMDIARPGRPVAQRYGLGGQWVHNFPVAKITGKDSNALKYDEESAHQAFSVGPPMLIHTDDALPLTSLWQKYMQPVLDVETDILADMWAYCMASAHLGLEHTIVDHHMISTWGRSGQSYQWVDKWEELSCRDPESSFAKNNPRQKSPTFIHMASNFKAPKSKEWMFHKGHVPADILSCSVPSIKEAPDNLWSVIPASGSPGCGGDCEDAKQSAWILCNTVARLNSVLDMYKSRFCPGGKYERKKTVRLIQDKNRDVNCDWRKQKWCWPLAQIEEESPTPDLSLPPRGGFNV
jgi:hypothetical protein